MSDSILQVNQIKDKGGNATGITVADTTANVTVGNLTATSLAGGTISSAVNFPAGHVIQVQTGTYATEGSTSSTGFQTTGISATITPRATSSTIFIIINTSGYNNGGTDHVSYYTIYRNSTDLGAGSTMGFANIYQGSGSGHDLGSNICISEVDSPSTTSAVTYTLRVRSSSTSHSAYWSMNNSKSDITVMEISG